VQNFPAIFHDQKDFSPFNFQNLLTRLLNPFVFLDLFLL